MDDPSIDMIHNCTPNHLHDEINLAAIAAGRHTYTEKPLSITVDRAYQVWKADRDIRWMDEGIWNWRKSREKTENDSHISEIKRKDQFVSGVNVNKKKRVLKW